MIGSLLLDGLGLELFGLRGLVWFAALRGCAARICPCCPRILIQSWRRSFLRGKNGHLSILLPLLQLVRLFKCLQKYDVGFAYLFGGSRSGVQRPATFALGSQRDGDLPSILLYLLLC